MPLPLNDPRWSELQGSYGGTVEVVRMLSEANKLGEVHLQAIGDIINEVQHQGDTTTAMFAVAPHLIDLARRTPASSALNLLMYAGLIYASSTRRGATKCPAFLHEEFAAYASEGARMLAPLIPTSTDFEVFKYAVAAMAGFCGHGSFGRLLDGLDFYQGQFHHSSLDRPFPEDI